MDERQRRLERAAAAGDPQALAQAKANIMRTVPCGFDDVITMDADQDPGFIKQRRMSGVWKVQGLRFVGLELRVFVRRIEGGALAPNDMLNPGTPRNALWLTVDKLQACLVRVGAPELSVGCPHCGEVMGEPCRRPSGRLHDAHHVARREALWAANAPEIASQAPTRPAADPVAVAELRARVAARMRAEGHETPFMARIAALAEGA